MWQLTAAWQTYSVASMGDGFNLITGERLA